MCKKLVKISNCGKAQAWPSSIICSLSTMCNLIPPPHSHELFLLNTVAYPSHFTFVRIVGRLEHYGQFGEKNLKSKFFQVSIFIINQFPCLSSYWVARRVKEKKNLSMYVFFFHPPDYSVAAPARKLVHDKNTYLKKFGFTKKIECQ